MTNRAINNYKEHYTDFQLIESKVITFKTNLAYTIVMIATKRTRTKVVYLSKFKCLNKMSGSKK